MHANTGKRTTTTSKRLQLALDAAHMSVWDSRIRKGNVMEGDIHWSADGARLLGLEAHARKQAFRDFLALIHPDDRQRVTDTMQDAVDKHADCEIEYRVVWPDASVHWIAAKVHVLTDSRGRAIRAFGIVWDATARKEAEITSIEQENLAQLTLNSIGDGVITIDQNGRVQYLNRVAEQLTGWASDDIDEQALISDVFKVIDEGSGDILENVAVKCLRLEQTIGIVPRSQLVARNGRMIAIEDSAAPIRAHDGSVLGAVVVFRDVSHERQLTHELSWHASHDPLTGLINRREFEVHIAAALASAKSDGASHALLYLDLDQFNVVNDTCGHSAGDALLKILAKMLQSEMRGADILARLGGDELGVLFLNCPLEQAQQLAEKIRQSIKNFRFAWEKYIFQISVSIGMVMINEDSTSMSDLLSAADQACYVAKEQGRNQVHLYRESDIMVAKRHGDVLWVSRLKSAFEKNKFVLYTQPIVSLNGVTRPHVEVLIRLTDYDGSLILPSAFISAAERYDAMLPIDRWVIETVCTRIRNEQQKAARNQSAGDQSGDAGMIYSVNLSGISINDDSLYSFIAETFQKHEIDPTWVCFELTETAIVSNLEKAYLFMEKIKKLGCKFSLDDFGSGLSSFAYLKSLPVDYLKIDGLFVRDISTNKINRAMVAAINQVGHVMGIKTIAEYVETDAILETVRDIGIDYAQGYAVGALQPLHPA